MKRPRCAVCGKSGRWYPIYRAWGHLTLPEDQDHLFVMPTPTEAEQDMVEAAHVADAEYRYDFKLPRRISFDEIEEGYVRIWRKYA